MSPGHIRPVSPLNGETVMNATPVMRDFYENCREYCSHEWREYYKTGEENYSIPQPVVLIWKGGQTFLTVTDENWRTVFSGEAESGFGLYNLVPGERYSWRAGDAEERTFIVDPTPPRWIYADGVFNVRDMGGWKTCDGKRVKCGLLYRGGEPGADSRVKSAGERSLTSRLGIKTEIDLKIESLDAGRNSSALGSDVRYELIPVDAYAEFIETSGEGCRKIFDLFADPCIYPAFFHCVAGADRTGTVAALLLALLRVEEESILVDYELTTLSDEHVRSRSGYVFSGFLEAMKKYGENIYVQTENLLRSFGVTDGTMNRIRDIFVE